MNRRVLVVLPLLLIAGLAAIAATWWSRRQSPDAGELTSSGTVEATEARLGFQSGGRILAVNVREGDRVQRGAVLATLDTSELDTRRRQAAARVDSMNAVLRELLSGSRQEEIGQAAAAVDAARERLADARRDLERNQTLYKGGAISQEILQKSTVATNVASAQLDQAQEQYRMVQRGPRTERIEAQRAQVAEAQAALGTVDAALANARAIAPMDGIVTIRHHEPNETVAPGQPVVTLIDPNDRWVRVYVPEDRLGSVHLGALATIASDTYRGKSYQGRVVYISPEAEFTPKNVQTAEERVRLVYAVKVRIENDPKMELKPGMPVDVKLRVGDQRT